MYQPINGWTKSQIIETIKLRPNYICVAPNSSACVYRDGRGGMCAVGAFIPDEFYAEDMEKTGSIKGILNRYTGLLDLMPLDADALRDLQRVHDEATTGADINANLISWVEANVNG